MKRRLLSTLMSMAVAGSVIAGSSLTSFAYTVQPGDTLGKIAAENNVTVEQIAAENGITNVNLIAVGQEITIPGTETSGTARVAIPNSVKTAITASFDAKYYAEQYPDVVAELGEDADKLLEHFLVHGIWEGRQMNKDFNVNAYASAYDDLREAFADESVAERIVSYYQHYFTFVESGIETRTLTTVDSVVSSGKTVTSVSSVAGSEGTVIAKPYVAPVVATKSLEAFIESAYERSKESIITFLNTCYPDDVIAAEWIAAGEECETPAQKVAWLYSFNYNYDALNPDSLMSRLEPNVAAAENWDSLVIFSEELYSSFEIDEYQTFMNQFTEYRNYMAASNAWYDAHPFDADAFIDMEAYTAAHDEWVAIDTTDYDEAMLQMYYASEPVPYMFYTQAYYEWSEAYSEAIQLPYYFGEWALATYYNYN